MITSSPARDEDAHSSMRSEHVIVILRELDNEGSPKHKEQSLHLFPSVTRFWSAPKEDLPVDGGGIKQTIDHSSLSLNMWKTLFSISIACSASLSVDKRETTSLENVYRLLSVNECALSISLSETNLSARNDVFRAGDVAWGEIRNGIEIIDLHRTNGIPFRRSTKVIDREKQTSLRELIVGNRKLKGLMMAFNRLTMFVDFGLEFLTSVGQEIDFNEGIWKNFSMWLTVRQMIDGDDTDD